MNHAAAFRDAVRGMTNTHDDVADRDYYHDLRRMLFLRHEKHVWAWLRHVTHDTPEKMLPMMAAMDLHQ